MNEKCGYRYLENIKDLINSKKPSLFFKDKTLENIFMAVFNLSEDDLVSTIQRKILFKIQGE